MTARRTAATELPWTLIHRAPSPMLRPHVRRLTAFQEWSGQAVLRKELPSATIPTILVFGPGFTLHDSGEPHAAWRPLARSFVAGLHERPALVGSLGTSLCLRADVTPIGTRRFLGLPPRTRAAGAVRTRHDRAGAPRGGEPRRARRRLRLRRPSASQP
jgi:hypothetical protein